MTTRLAPCPSCTRHVKVGSSSCPFCNGEVPVDVPARPMPATRPLTRAAIMFASVAAVSAVAAWLELVDDHGEKDAEASTDGQVHAAYGVFVDPDAGLGEPDGAVHAAYGVAVLPDSGQK